MSASVEILPDLQTLLESAQEHVISCALTSVQSRGRFTLALSGGKTPRALYERLAQHPELPWQHMQLCFGDERAVPPEHPDSNARMVHEALTHCPFVPASNVHRIRAELPAAEAAQSYQQTLRALFPEPGPPRFDLVLLGLGADGHTASLFPHSPALAERDRWVTASWAPAQRSERITLTLPVLNAAAQVLFLVAGSDKGWAVRELLEGSASVEELPARGVQPVAGGLTFLLDRAAAAQLTRTAD